MFYTYAHYRADDNRIFYIGKGKGDRHKDKTHRNPHWNNVVVKHGYRIEILGCWKSEQDAFDHEVFLIKTFREMGHKLVNITDGGEGASGRKMTEKMKQRLREINLGKTLSPETRAKIAESVRNMSDETRARKEKYYRSVPDSAKLKMSNSHKGKIVSIETCLKMSESHKKRHKSFETLIKIKEGHKKKEKKIYCVEYDVIFNSIKLASCVTGIASSSIGKACSGKRPHAEKIHFRYL